MSRKVLLYGASGYSGRLIANEAVNRWIIGSGLELVLGGRDRATLESMVAQFPRRIDCRVFGLEEREPVVRALRDIDVVVNAAGPFALTAERLAKACISSLCHYVDINGEFDVYQRLDDLGVAAEQRNVTLVCGAGHTTAASDLMLEEALTRWTSRKRPKNTPDVPLGSIRIAMKRLDGITRGSAATILRSWRQQVPVIRDYQPGGGRSAEPTVRYIAAGAVERTFDFGSLPKTDADFSKRDARIATVAGLIDTLNARLAVTQHAVRVRTIESYLECLPATRDVYAWLSLVAPVLSLSPFAAALRAPLALLPEGPSDDELGSAGHGVLLQIEDATGKTVVEWVLSTPNVYCFTASIAVSIAGNLACADAKRGWVRPVEALPQDVRLLRPVPNSPLRGCILHERTGFAT